jgi:23S rRNA (cytidine1920-2'-O)/16S rRNA (cytidine1409-2'-O)-methyltransferase
VNKTPADMNSPLPEKRPFVSRAGEKLEHAMGAFAIDVQGKVCADLGSNTGGFVDCMLRRGAAKVYAIDTGYGVLDWNLRRDARVVVMERTNAMHATLPEAVDVVSIDVAWTRQRNILPAARRLLKPGGCVVSLIKPHYEAAARLLRKGVLPEDQLGQVIEQVKVDISAAGFVLAGLVDSPLKGAKGNREMLAYLIPEQGMAN